MASGIHWEWRGFGGVSSQFVNNYTKLPVITEPYIVDDLYLWIPGLSVNAKLRTGTEGDLKFKRIRDRAGNFEKWREDPDEIFDFPLTRQAWQTLARSLQTVDIHLPNYPSEAIGRQEVLQYLTANGCKTVHVKKHRESRLWQGPNTGIQVEWACVSAPQSIISIGLEGWSESETDNLPDDLEKQDLKSAIEALSITNEPLRMLNYLDAVQIWANGEKI